MAQKHTIRDIAARKGGVKLAALTCYTANMARLMDAHLDILLVGDSLGMVIYGLESTLAVPLEWMIAHGRAVAAAARHALVVVDMPFGSYQASKEQAFTACARIMAETGCAAVKLEGGSEMAGTVRYLTERGIPVMGHIGLMPQRVHAMGGYRYQGRSDAEAAAILEDGLAIAAAGAFAIVIEGVREDIARHVTGQLPIPTIGIGASPACDGQIMVIDDMLGLSGAVPGFVRHYAQLGETVEQAVKAYAEDVRSGAFPSPQYCYPFPKKP